MTTEIMNISFYDDKIQMIDHNGEPYVPVKPLCVRLGLNLPAQYKKFRQEPEMWSVVSLKDTTGESSTPSADGKYYEMTCLPLQMVPAWLFSLSPSRVKPELREDLILYRKECAKVLWDHWSGAHRKELQLYQDYCRKMSFHLLAAKPGWNRVVRLAEIGWERKSVAHFCEWKNAKSNAIFTAMVECGLLPDREQDTGKTLRKALPWLGVDHA